MYHLRETIINKSMESLKDNHHRKLHHLLTTGKISPEEYTRKIEYHNRIALKKMLRDNLSKKYAKVKP